MRAHLAQVLIQQKRALDLVSGFVDTQQLGELQAAGHEYDKAINSTQTASGPGNSTNQPPATSPTAPPADILNAGVTNAQNDPGRQYDPRYSNTGSVLGYNPLNIFDQQMHEYQTNISQSESLASQAILKAVPACGGRAPGSPATPPPDSPTVPAAPAPASPLPAPSAAPAFEP